MIVKGVVLGPVSRRYAGFYYRKPVASQISIWQLDPERLHPANEYPRSVNPPSQPSTQTLDCADYTVQAGEVDVNTCMAPVRVTMQPNEYTEAKAPLVVVEFFVSGSTIAGLHRMYIDEAVRRAFG